MGEQHLHLDSLLVTFFFKLYARNEWGKNISIIQLCFFFQTWILYFERVSTSHRKDIVCHGESNILQRCCRKSIDDFYKDDYARLLAETQWSDADSKARLEETNIYPGRTKNHYASNIERTLYTHTLVPPAPFLWILAIIVVLKFSYSILIYSSS